MARAGIYKSEVLRARAKLLAQGIYPSIDAVRAELGNTGSKSTIHRLLKEIEEEEGGSTGAQVAVSEAIQDLVGRLAGRLHEEADARVAEAAEGHRLQMAEQNETITALRSETEGFRSQLERTQVALSEAQALHEETVTSLRAAALEGTKLTQQVVDLQERLAAEENHRQSLEEKHQHAREALEHFRQSVKEQRDQEQRQHDQQVQYLQGEIKTLNQVLSEKQHEAIRSNQENARLTNELARAESINHQVQAELRALKGTKEELASATRQVEELGRKVVEQEAAINGLTETNTSLEQQVVTLTGQARQLEVDLATAKATAATEDVITEKIRALVAAALPTEKTAHGKKSGAKNQDSLFNTEG